jgi:hypothetical protein
MKTTITYQFEGDDSAEEWLADIVNNRKIHDAVSAWLNMAREKLKYVPDEMPQDAVEAWHEARKALLELIADETAWID